jgi:hypothetical protein
VRTDAAIRKVKGLQRDFLAWIERHPVFYTLEPDAFNDIRKRVFRGTFEVYRLGVVGLPDDTDLFELFFDWLNNPEAQMAPAYRREISEKCLRTALEAYRIGAQVAAATPPA